MKQLLLGRELLPTVAGQALEVSAQEALPFHHQGHLVQSHLGEAPPGPVYSATTTTMTAALNTRNGAFVVTMSSARGAGQATKTVTNTSMFTIVSLRRTPNLKPGHYKVWWSTLPCKTLLPSLLLTSDIFRKKGCTS